jgi:hypothetical protein
VFVVSEDFVGAPAVKVGQCGTTGTDFQKIDCQTATPTVMANPLQTLFGGLANSDRNAFPGRSRQFANRPFRDRIFDVQWHFGT